jgi:adenosine deaminase CECR1
LDRSSYDFYQVLVGSEATGLISLGVLARLSIEHSMMEDDVKKKCLDVWERQWAQFVESI